MDPDDLGTHRCVDPFLGSEFITPTPSLVLVGHATCHGCGRTWIDGRPNGKAITTRLARPDPRPVRGGEDDTQGVTAASGPVRQGTGDLLGGLHEAAVSEVQNTTLQGDKVMGNNPNAPWLEPQYQDRWIKWTAPGAEVEGILKGWEQGEFPATETSPAKPYAIAILDTANGEKELALSLVDLREQVFAAKPAIGDTVYARYIRDVEKKKIFEVKVNRPIKQETAPF